MAMQISRVNAWPWLLLSGLITLTLGFSGHAADRGDDTRAMTIQAVPAERNGQHDFDFEFGRWEVRLSRLAEPLAGSDAWVDYSGTSVVRKVWDGRANLGELEVSGPSGAIRGLSLRLYDPESREWRISWANARDGSIGPPMSGGFLDDGRGVFYGEETYDGRSVFVRFVFSDITNTTFRFEQAFSDDGGTTWEPNWVARFTRQ